MPIYRNKQRAKIPQQLGFIMLNCPHNFPHINYDEWLIPLDKISIQERQHEQMQILSPWVGIIQLSIF